MGNLTRAGSALFEAVEASKRASTSTSGAQRHRLASLGTSTPPTPTTPRLKLYSSEANRRAEAAKAEGASAGASSSANDPSPTTTIVPLTPFQQAMAMFPPISTASTAPITPAAITTPSVPAAPRKIGNQRVPDNHPSQRNASVSTAAPVSAPVSAPPPVPDLKLGNYTVEAAETPAPTPSVPSSALSDTLPLPSANDDCGLLAPNDLLEALIKPAISGTFSSPLPPPPLAPLAPPRPPAAFQGAFPSLTWQQELQEVSIAFPQAWETLVGLFFQESGRAPVELADSTNNSMVLREYWGPDARKQDLGVDNSQNIQFEKGEWPQGDGDFASLVAAVNNGGQAIFESVMRSWAGHCPDRVRFVLQKAGWLRPYDRESSYPEERRVVSNILMMEEGEPPGGSSKGGIPALFPGVPGRSFLL